MSKTTTKRTPRSGEKRTAKMTLYLTPALRKSLRFQALREDKSATALVEGLITEHLAEATEKRETLRRTARKHGNR